MSDRRILAVHSDTHAGLRYALMNPETVLYAEDEKGNPYPWQPEMTKTQEYLWKIYCEHIDTAIAIADGSPMTVDHLGDECNGNKHPDLLVSNRIADQVIIAEMNTHPWFNYPMMQHYRQVVGTGAHNLGFGSTAMLVVSQMKARFPGVDIQPLYHGLMDIGGVLVDYAHHGPFPGSREWLKGNVARFYLRDLMMRDLQDGRTPPRLVLRGHYHQPVKEYLEHAGHEAELFVLPSYTMINDHAMQAAQSPNKLTHGMIVFEIEDGKVVETHRLYQTIDIRTEEKV